MVLLEMVGTESGVNWDVCVVVMVVVVVTVVIMVVYSRRW